jgi:hypothetical protein
MLRQRNTVSGIHKPVTTKATVTHVSEQTLVARLCVTLCFMRARMSEMHDKMRHFLLLLMLPGGGGVGEPGKI